VLSILLQERFLEDVCVPRNHEYPRLLLLLLISAGKLSEGGDVEEYRRKEKITAA